MNQQYLYKGQIIEFPFLCDKSVILYWTTLFSMNFFKKIPVIPIEVLYSNKKIFDSSGLT